MYGEGGECTRACIWRLEDNFWDITYALLSWFWGRVSPIVFDTVLHKEIVRQFCLPLGSRSTRIAGRRQLNVLIGYGIQVIRFASKVLACLFACFLACFLIFNFLFLRISYKYAVKYEHLYYHFHTATTPIFPWAHSPPNFKAFIPH